MSENLWNIDKIPFVGTSSLRQGLGFRYYDAERVVAGKTMREWLRFGVAYWHSFQAELVDPFGEGTAQRPFDGKTPSRSIWHWPRLTTPLTSTRRWALTTSASMTATSLPKATHCAKPTQTSTRLSMRSKQSRRKPASSSCGTPLHCSPIAASFPAQQPRRSRRSTPTPAHS